MSRMGGKPHAWQAHAVGRRVEEVGWGGTYSVGVAKAASAEYSSAACSEKQQRIDESRQENTTRKAEMARR